MLSSKYTHRQVELIWRILGKLYAYKLIGPREMWLIFKGVYILSMYGEIGIRWLAESPIGYKSILVQVLAWWF